MSWSRQWTPLLLVLALTPAGLCLAAPLQQASDTDAQLREALDKGRWSDVKRLVRNHGAPDWLSARSKELTDEFRGTLAAPVKDRG
ncbi:MAG: hypothetical protein O7C98_03205, partial [Planctomycetota bacterium]|nr:hypothetical protein [Planctomycetota bacterium]